MKILEDQDFTLILLVCFDVTADDAGVSLLEMDRVVRKEIHDRESSAREGEEKIESLCHAFEETKPYLILRWEK